MSPVDGTKRPRPGRGAGEPRRRRLSGGDPFHGDHGGGDDAVSGHRRLPHHRLGLRAGCVRPGRPYNLANTIPNILHDIVLGGIVAATFVPVFVERLTTPRADEAWEAISAVMSVASSSSPWRRCCSWSPLRSSSTPSPPSTTARRPPTERTAWPPTCSSCSCPNWPATASSAIATALLNSRRQLRCAHVQPMANNVFLIAVLL